MPEFQINDRVIIIFESENFEYGSDGGRWFRIGDSGTIAGIEINGILVDFDFGSRYYTQPEELKLLVQSEADLLWYSN